MSPRCFPSSCLSPLAPLHMSLQSHQVDGLPLVFSLISSVTSPLCRHKSLKGAFVFHSELAFDRGKGKDPGLSACFRSPQRSGISRSHIATQVDPSVLLMREPKLLRSQSHTQLSHLSSSIDIPLLKAAAENLSRARDPKIKRKKTPSGKWVDEVGMVGK
jgi:hypothetical protein